MLKELKEVVKDKEDIFIKDSTFQELQEFYERMKKQGLVIKKDYTIPPIDTIGYKKDTSHLDDSNYLGFVL